MFLPFLFFPLFDIKVLGHEYRNIQVYAPKHLVNDVYNALISLPGVKFQLVDSQSRNQEKTQEEQYSIGMDYYDYHEHRFSDLPRRRTASHGGYTSDQDTCQMYNHNLVKIWSKFSKYVIPGNQEVPSKMALHNIAQIVEAYLGHQDSYSENDKETNPDAISEKGDKEAEPDVSDIVSKIKKVIEDTVDVDTSDKIVDLIIRNVLATTEGKWDDNCAKRARERLGTYVSGTFQKYLENATCRKSTINDGSNKIRHVTEDRKLNINDAQKFMKQWQNDYENCDKNAQDKFLHIIRLIIQNYINDLRCKT